MTTALRRSRFATIDSRRHDQPAPSLAIMATRTAPHTALLIVDMINPFDFEGAASLLRGALPAARAIARLKAALKRARAGGLHKRPLHPMAIGFLRTGRSMRTH